MFTQDRHLFTARFIANSISPFGECLKKEAWLLREQNVDRMQVLKDLKLQRAQCLKLIILFCSDVDKTFSRVLFL